MSVGSSVPRRQVVVAVVMFLLGWAGPSVPQWWQDYRMPRTWCESNLRLVHIVVHSLTKGRKVSSIDTQQLTVAMGKRFFVLNQAQEAYLLGRTQRYTGTEDGVASEGSTIVLSASSLVCHSDPDWAIKQVLSMPPAQGLEPSYRFFPNLHTVAYCPFHRLAVRTDGSIHKE